MIDRGYLRGHILLVSAKRFAHVDHHVDVVRTFGHGFLGFDDFDFGGAIAIGEADDGADLDGRAGEDFRGLSDRVGFDEGGGRTLWWRASWRPSSMVASVMVGWRREWSTNLARMARETVVVLGSHIGDVMGWWIKVEGSWVED